MSTTSLTQSQLQHRKMLVFLPVVFVPFLTIFFYLLGGGKAVSANPVAGGQALSRLNADVPMAWKDNKIYNSKRLAYEKIGQDSMTIRRNTARSLLDGGLEALQFDSSYFLAEPSVDSGLVSALNHDLDQTSQQKANSPEAKAMQEAQRAYEEALLASSGEKPASLSFSPPASSVKAKASPYNQPAPLASQSASTALATSRALAKPKSKEEALKDKLIDDYNATQRRSHQMLELLQKRLEAENAAMAAASKGEAAPEEKKESAAASTSVKINIKPKQIKKPVVTHLEQKNRQPTYIYQVKSLLSDTTRRIPRANNGFYSAEKGKKDSETANVILAAIHDEQILEAGSTVKIRLLHDIEVGGQRIPKGSFIFGLASIEGTRMAVSINSIYFKEMLYQVELALFDVDGIKGLSTPASVARTMAKQGAAQGLGGANFIGTSPTPQSQLTQKAIEVGENIARRKIQAVRVTLKAGHQVLLKPASVENSK